MHKINSDKAQMLTQFRPVVAWCSDAECSVWGRNLVGSTPPAEGHGTHLMAFFLQNKCWTLFSFFIFFFFIKAKVLFEFLSINESRYKCMCFIKPKWHRVRFQNPGTPVCESEIKLVVEVKIVLGKWHYLY